MKCISLRLLWLILAGQAFVCSGADDDPPAVHDPAVHVGAGLKKELIAGITEADFLKLGTQPRTVKVTLVASLSDDNSGMNFNGYSHGKAVYLIPAGWTVEVTFINPSPVPHSVIVVDRDMLKKVQVGEPAIKGASIPSPLTGISTSKATFTFTASPPGKYALVCGIPTHAMGGHWVALEVSASARVPTLSLGEASPKEAQ